MKGRDSVMAGGGKPQPTAPGHGANQSPMGANPSPAAQPASISIRKAVASDLPYIFATWLESYGSSAYAAMKIPKQIYYTYQHLVIERVLSRNATVLVATTKSDEHTILGYLVFETDVPIYKTFKNRRTNSPETSITPRPVVHYLYTRHPVRRLGIASQLVKASGLDMSQCQFTHWTDRKFHNPDTFQPIILGNADDLLKKWPALTYNPYAV